jgi:hypothetical protein
MSTRAFLFFAFCSSFLRRTTAQQTCYYPDGTPSGDIQCQGDENTQSFCCPSGAVCQKSPGPVCKLPNGDFLRGSCTVQDWSSSECPKFCLGKFPLVSCVPPFNSIANVTVIPAITSDNPLVQCQTTKANGNWCCGYDADKDLCDCNTNNNTFFLGNYEPAEISGTVTISHNFDTPTASAKPSTVASSSPTTTTFASTTVTTGNPTAQSQTQTQSATTGTSTPTSSPVPASTGMSTGAKVGIGVGVPLGIALLALLGYLLYRSGRNSNKTKPQKQPQEIDSRGVYPGPPPPMSSHPGTSPGGAYNDTGYYQQYNGYAPDPKDSAWARGEGYGGSPPQRYQYTPSNGTGPGTEGTLSYGMGTPEHTMRHELPAGPKPPVEAGYRDSR